jgi:hypothetical protein
VEGGLVAACLEGASLACSEEGDLAAACLACSEEGGLAVACLVAGNLAVGLEEGSR